MLTICKKLLFTIYGLLLVTALHAQSSQTPLEDIVNAFRSDRLTDIEKYYDNIVPITLNNNLSTYSKTQAELVLKDFFSRNNPTDFTIQNSGTPNNSSKYAIGECNTASGKYSFYILLKSKDNGNTFLLQQVTFNKE
jgi:hypothetical protein